MKTASFWLRPTKSSPACRYSYNPTKGKPAVGRIMYSDCRVWMTFFAREAVVTDPGKDICPFCSIGHVVSPPRGAQPSKPKRSWQTQPQNALRYVHHTD